MAKSHRDGAGTAIPGRVLIVDDDRDVVQIMQRVLERAGYETVSAFSGMEALERLEAAGRPGGDAVDLVLLDILMPGMDGIQACQSIRSRPNGATIPIIMVTAVTSFSDQMAAFEAGANDYVTKPFHPPELLARVHAFTRLRAAEAERQQAERTLRRRNRELQVLYNLTSDLVRARSAEEILTVAADHVADVFSSEGVAAVLLDEEGRARVQRAARGTAQIPWIEALRMNLTDDSLLEAMRAAQGPVVLTGAEVQSQGGVWGQTGSTGLVAVPVGQQMVGALIVLCASEQATAPANASLLSAFAQQMSVAVENVRLLEEMDWARTQLRQLAGRVVQAQEDERRRIARELHDGVGQALTGLKLNLAVLESALLDQGAAVDEQVAEIRVLLECTMEEIRGLALGLRPAALDDLGLVPAVRGYVNEFIKRTGLEVVADLDASIGRLPEQVETALYRIIQEAMVNIVRHAAARHVYVCLKADGDEVCACVIDDGRGFDTTRRLKAAVEQGRMGLLGIQERVALLQGRVKIIAAPGKGTTIEVHLLQRQET